MTPSLPCRVYGGHKMYNAAVQKQYHNTPKGKATRKRYQHSRAKAEYMRRYAKTAKGRAVLSAKHARRTAKRFNTPGSWTGDQFLVLCKKYGNVCLCCHKKRRLTPDHVIPFSKGGTNHFVNIQPLCLPCNNKKNSNTTDYKVMAQEAA